MKNTTKILAPGTRAKINQGFGLFTEVEIVEYFSGKNVLGNPRHYTVKVLGGVTVFGKPAEVGAIKTNVCASNMVVD